MNTARKLGSHIQTDRGTCSGVGLWSHGHNKHINAIWRAHDAVKREHEGANRGDDVLVWPLHQRFLALYLPRLAFLVGIEADRLGAWFPGPLGPYAGFFSALTLVGTSNGWKCREPPWEVRFVFGVFWGQILAITVCARRQPSHVKHLLSALCNLLKRNYHSLYSPPGDPRVRAAAIFWSEFCLRFRFFSRWLESVPGAHSASAFAQALVWTAII
jgi:hypothetical protein